jgi:putative DNA-invertase from lambdoid prophage Rac
MVQAAIATKRAVVYARVSTAEQDTARQERGLKAFAERAGYDVQNVFVETASGAKNDRKERAKVMKLA